MRPSEQIRQFHLHAGHAQQSGNALRLEFNQYVDVALRSEVLPQSRAEDGKPFDAVLPAKRGQLTLRGGYIRIHRFASVASPLLDTCMITQDCLFIFLLALPRHE